MVFRDITLRNPRIGFSIHFDSGRFSRSYYPCAEVPVQQGIVLDHICVAHDEAGDFLRINTPVDSILVANSRIGRRVMAFCHAEDVAYGQPVAMFF